MSRSIVKLSLLLGSVWLGAWTLSAPAIAQGQASAAEAGETINLKTVPDRADLIALNYYVQTQDRNAVESELRRLMLKYPRWQPPQDLTLLAVTAPSKEIDQIYRAIAAGKFAEARRIIATTQEVFADWTPPDEMMDLLETAEGQVAFDNLLASNQLDEAIAQAMATPGLLRCDRINNAWRIAEGQIRANRKADALTTYRSIAAACTNPPEMIATLEKADSVASVAEILALVAQVEERLPAMKPQLEATLQRLLAGRGLALLPIEEEETGPAAVALPPEAIAEAAGRAIAAQPFVPTAPAQGVTYVAAPAGASSTVTAPMAAAPNPPVAAAPPVADAPAQPASPNPPLPPVATAPVTAAPVSPPPTVAEADVPPSIGARRVVTREEAEALVKPPAAATAPTAKAPAASKPKSTASSVGGGGGGNAFQAAFNAGDWSRCLALSNGSRVSTVVYQRGWCAYNLNQPMEAVKSFRQALSGRLDSTQIRDAYYGIALAYLKMQMPEEASRIAARVDFTDKQRRDVERQILDQRGVAAYKRKDFRQAVAYFNALEQVAGGIRRDLAIMRAYALLNSGHRAKAYAEFKRLNDQLSTRETLRGLEAAQDH